MQWGPFSVFFISHISYLYPCVCAVAQQVSCHGVGGLIDKRITHLTNLRLTCTSNVTLNNVFKLKFVWCVALPLICSSTVTE